jgi:AraC-like DNA-binding protein
LLEVADGYREIRPGGRLARYLECYWFRQDPPGGCAHRVLPDGCVDILFTRHGEEPAGLDVVGLMTAPMEVAPAGGRSFFGIRFQPGMASAFVPGGGAALDLVRPLEEFWGREARAMKERLAHAADPQEMAALMDRMLRPAEPAGEAERMLWELAGGEDVDDLARQSSLSSRQLRRLCHERAGVGPKYLSRILRFRRAAEHIQNFRAQPSWAQFAVSCGYYDQAHFIREFQEFAGVTPDRFLQYRGRGSS